MRLPKTVPKLEPVDSSNVKAVGYDPRRQYLYVQFNPDDDNQHGAVYRYAGVMELVYHRFMSAPSKGQFMWKNIKDKYQYEKWSGFGWKKERTLRRRTAQKKRIKQRIRKSRRR